MRRKSPATLIELAIQILLKNELSLIQHLEEMPEILYIPLFRTAFSGGYRMTLSAILNGWPFFCLHVGTLRVPAKVCEIMTIMINSLQIPPVQNSTSRSSKLRILDLRPNTWCAVTCPEISTGSSNCLYSCSDHEHTVLSENPEDDSVNSESETQPSRNTMEVIVDLCLCNSQSERNFISMILTKVEENLGFLHLCCRSLRINASYEYKNTLKLFRLTCIDNLTVSHASLSELTIILRKIKHLYKLRLYRINYISLDRKVFTTFLKYLGQIASLKEFCISHFSCRNHLEQLLRALPPDLNCLYLPFCEVSPTDFAFLPECPQANHLRRLDLSHNPLLQEDCENIQILLGKLSGTLKHLSMNHCLLTDSTVSLFLPALSHCLQLKEFTFVCNPISMTMLRRIVHQLTLLKVLKIVKYPIPSHCYDGLYFLSNLNREELDGVKAEVKSMVEAALREDMTWLCEI